MGPKDPRWTLVSVTSQKTPVWGWHSFRVVKAKKGKITNMSSDEFLFGNRGEHILQVEASTSIGPLRGWRLSQPLQRALSPEPNMAMPGTKRNIPDLFWEVGEGGEVQEPQMGLQHGFRSSFLSFLLEPLNNKGTEPQQKERSILAIKT